MAKVEAGETEKGQLAWEGCFLQRFRQGSDMVRESFWHKYMRMGHRVQDQPQGGRILIYPPTFLQINDFVPKAEQKAKGDCVILLLCKPITFKEGGACQNKPLLNRALG